MEREIDQHLEREGLTHTQYEVLGRLSTAPHQRLRMTELAGALYSTRSGLSFQITQLEKAGLVRRETCPTDVRGVIAGLTPTAAVASKKSRPDTWRRSAVSWSMHSVPTSRKLSRRVWTMWSAI
ncbi:MULTISPECIES: MarR family winged helix-turn-helix transcriptional regulator [Nocardia]|uniref:MarR family winged helix-turn-helix transcriptional regulator n=1 Tax=Nocardia abscessus TaxID=120957 RepID=UPI002B4B0482|nr:MarR family transcriptional regulator [Nocardia abscessus]